MNYFLQKTDRRSCKRYTLRENVTIGFGTCSPNETFIVRDISEDGVSVFVKNIQEKDIGKHAHIDLIWENQHFILRSLASQVIFWDDSDMCGLKFLNLSGFQRRALKVFIDQTRHSY